MRIIVTDIPCRTCGGFRFVQGMNTDRGRRVKRRICMDCRARQSRERYARNPEQARERSRRWKARHRQHVRDYSEEYRDLHHEEVLRKQALARRRSGAEPRRFRKRERYLDVLERARVA